MAYLAINKNRGVSPSELIDVLWPEGASADPISTLQNNISRARALLKDKGFDQPKQIIAYKDGMYSWAPGITTVLDVDQFESSLRQAQAALAAHVEGQQAYDQSLSQAMDALDGYRGDFLPDASQDAWCMSLRVYYRSLYVRLAKTTAQLLFKKDRYADVVRICTRAYAVDPTIEDFSIYLMRSLVAEGNPDQALEHYEATKRLFEENYCATPSVNLEIEHAAAVRCLYGQTLPEREIREFLADDTGLAGAFYCSNMVFREMVRLHMRDTDRSKKTSQIAIISVKDGSDTTRGSMREKHASNMRRLQMVILNCLRAGDSFTKMTTSQYLVLLPGATTQNGNMVMERILAHFRQDYPFVKIELNFSVFNLTDIMKPALSGGR